MNAHGAKSALRLAASIAAEVANAVMVPAASGLDVSVPEGVEPAGARQLFDELIDDLELQQTSRELFINGHFALAVEEAFKYLNNLVKLRSDLTSDGADLMNKAFSPGNAILKLSDLKTQSQRDQQTGYMQMMAGAMTGIRNPRAHEHRYLDDPRAALELLCLANHLARMARAARRTRRRKLK